MTSGLIAPPSWGAATLTGSFSSIPKGTVINLSAAGPVDWVHWGLYTATSLDRKAGVTPQISDFIPLDNTNGGVSIYQFSDNYNGYAWSDGTPTATVTNTTTGVWAYGSPAVESGFEISVPADTTVRTLKVYVGAFAAEGLFTASLSDGSAAPYNDFSLSNKTNGPSGAYSIQYAANSPGQTLTVGWTLKQVVNPRYILSANVTLQAAALTSSGANNPPIVSITSPTENATITASANITITADASDFDGKVAKVEFYDGPDKLGADTTSPYSYSWNSVPAGYHVLTAVATDTNADFSISEPVEIFVNGTGGTLSGVNGIPPSALDLTLEGTSDWAHWGLTDATSFDHKNGVTQRISDLTVLGTNVFQQYGDNLTAFSWSDGTPTASAANSTTGVYITGQTNGFEMQVPADTTTKRLKVYVGLYGARGNFQAYLSDFSARAYTDTTLSNVYGNSYAVFTLDYSAASAGQSLIIQYRSMALYDFDFGNVTFQAATLVETNMTVTTNSAPTITQQPMSLVVTQGNTANFSVTANGSPSPTYQWRFGSNNLSGATASGYTVNNAQATSAGDYDVIVSNSSGSVTSLVATLTVRIPPAITGQPNSLVVTQGNSANFTVAATGDAPLNYQWRFGMPGVSGGDLAGATNSTLTITNAQSTNAGNYRVIVSNAVGTTNSVVATLTVEVPPAITTPPQSQTVNTGSNVAFTVMAAGTTPFGYQWRFNGVDLSGANASSYLVTNAQPSNSGPYTVMVTNFAGSVTSAPAALTVLGELVLDFQLFSTNGHLGLTVFPSVAQPYALDASSTLTNWASIFTNQSGGIGSNFIQAPITNTPHRFFRGKRWP